jgi:hypothetical protein
MIKSKLTFRVPDLGYAPRYFVFFAALGFSRFDGESTSHPKRVTQPLGTLAKAVLQSTEKVYKKKAV